MKKRLLAYQLTFDIIVLLAVLLTANVYASTRLDAQATKITTVQLSFWGDPWEINVMNKLVKVFELENPNIKVKTRHVPYEEYFPAVNQWFATNSAPDVLFLSHIEYWASRGYLLPLNKRIERDRFDTQDFYPTLLQLFKWNVDYYGFPRDNDTKVIFYNKRLLNAAHLDVPKCGWQWSDFKYFSDELTNKSKQQFGVIHDGEWLTLLYQQNQNILSQTTSNLTRSPEGIEAIEWFLKLIQDNSPVQQMNVSSKIATDYFKNEKVAMMYGNHAQVSELLKYKHLDWGVVCLPQKRRAVNKIGGAGYVINQKTVNPEASWQLLKWLSSRKGQALFTESGAIFPARRSVAQSNLYNKLVNKAHTHVFTMETLRGFPVDTHRNTLKYIHTFRKNFNAVLGEEIDIQLAISKTNSETNELFPIYN